MYKPHPILVIMYKRLSIISNIILQQLQTLYYHKKHPQLFRKYFILNWAIDPFI